MIFLDTILFSSSLAISIVLLFVIGIANFITKFLSLQGKRWKKSEASKYQDEYDENTINSIYNKKDHNSYVNNEEELFPDEDDENRIRNSHKLRYY